LDRALEVSYQILDALDAAHKRVITHRDLKRANVLVAKQGIKLLDFGLAKQEVQLAPTDATLTKALTSEGQLLGTLQYMSPEQTQGQNADARSDIFAFGCVFHELITGKRAFNGASVAAIIAAILKDEPEPRAIPDAIDRVIKTSLAKDPDARFQSAADCKRALHWATEARSPDEAKKDWLWPAVAAVALTPLAFVALKPAPKPPPRAPVTFQIEPPEGTRFKPNDVRISPDGQTLAFMAGTSPDDGAIWVRPLQSLQSTKLPGTEKAVFIFWAPDSKSFGYYDGSAFRRVGLNGGGNEKICAAADVAGATWGKDGTILFGQNRGPLQIVRAGSSSAADLFPPGESDRRHSRPMFLDDGEHFVYRVMAGENSGIYHSSIHGGPKTRLPIDLVPSGSIMAPPNVRYGGGYLIFGKGESVVAQRIDSKTGRLEGDPLTIAENSLTTTTAMSDNGTLSHVPVSAQNANGDLLEVDRRGERLRSFGPGKGYYSHPEMSPDGKALAIDYRDPVTGEYDIWTIDLARSTPNRLTFPPAHGAVPAWSGDGSRIFFGRQGAVYSVAATGGGEPQKLAETNSHHKAASPDGRSLYIEFARMSSQSRRIASVALDQPGKIDMFTGENHDSMNPQVSPDGKWLAYDSTEVGGREVFVESIPPGKGKWQISRTGARGPRWRRDGKELYFADGFTLMAVEIGAAPGGAIQPGQPKALFEMNAINSSDGYRFTVSPDGQRFYYVAPMNSNVRAAPPAVTITLNWLPQNR